MTHVEHKHIFRLKNKYFILHSWIKFKRKVWNECKIGHKIVSIKIEWLAMPAYNSFNFIRWHLPVQPCHSPVVSSYVPSLPITKYSDLSLVCSQFSVLCKSTDGQSLSPPSLPCYSLLLPSGLSSGYRTLKNFWYLYLSTAGICNLAKKLPWSEWF